MFTFKAEMVGFLKLCVALMFKGCCTHQEERGFGVFALFGLTEKQGVTYQWRSNPKILGGQKIWWEPKCLISAE